MDCKRIMVSAVKSGSGKTTVTMGILKALTERGISVRAFKTGPDYIDPMFHKRITGKPSGNLDPFFQDRALMRSVFVSGSSEAEISVIEGAMGYYDGIGFDGPEKSAYECALNLGCPVILVLDGKGISYSLTGVIKGMIDLRPDSNIRGVIINNIPERSYLRFKDVIERETGIKVLGFLPRLAGCSLKERHLGLMTPAESPDLDEKISVLGKEAESHIDIDGILEIAGEAESLEADENLTLIHSQDCNKTKRIAVARDEAFSFIYEENMEFLKNAGCEILYFSPLRDKELPKDIDGLILCGGYPEEYAKELSANTEMLCSIRNALLSGVPALAECGGFMYLHEYLYDRESEKYKMVGFIKGESCHFTGKLGHFGYVLMEPKEDNPLVKKGEFLKAHEFHYYDTSLKGGIMNIRKASDTAGLNVYSGMHLINNVFCGFPHFYYPAVPELIERFLKPSPLGRKA